MATLLAKKQNPQPMATSDNHHELLASDPNIPDFPPDSKFGMTQPSIVQTQPVVMTPSAPTEFTRAGENAGQNADILVKNDNKDWINNKWRPAMGWLYMTVCFFDFVLFPIMYTVVQFWEKEAANDAFRQWQPITLAGAGLFHMAMGAVLGITAYGRTKEKLGDKA